MSGQRKSEGSIGELIGLIIMISVGFVAITALTPAFLFVSILDVLLNLKQGPLWGLTVLLGIGFVSYIWKQKNGDWKETAILCLKISIPLAIGLLILGLIFSGNIFYVDTINKMFD
jgi:hypothetical protein